MRKSFLSFLLLLSFVISIPAQKVDIVDRNLRASVAYLASDALEGRRTGEPGANLAAKYVEKMFRQYKLKPRSKDGLGKPSFLQTFPHVTAMTLGAGNALSFYGDEKNALKVGEDWMPLAFSSATSFETAKMIDVGYGISATTLGHDDYRGLDVKGKVVIATDTVPDRNFASYDNRRKATIARDAGAKGLIIAGDVSKYRKLNYDNLGDAGIPVLVVSERLIAEKRKDDSSVSVKIDLVKKTADAYNVVGYLPGTDPKLKDEAIVFGAHYDHLGHGGQGSLAINSTEIHHGADDNASGTAALIEVARQYAAKGKNKRTLIFISFSGEEEGLLGSKFYVNNPLYPLDKCIAMLNLDMVGRLKDKKLNVGGIGTAEEWRELVTKKNEVIPPVYGPRKGASFTPTAPESSYRFSLQLSEDGYGPSDHASFYAKQMPVLFFFTGTHEDYHKPSDTAEKINYAGLKTLVEYVVDIGNFLDWNPKRPTYKVAQSSGQGEGRRGFAVTIGVVPGYGESNDGMLLDGVRDGGPAALAGIKAGDKIIKFAGKEIRSVQDYVYVLGDLKADTEYEIVVKRGDETLTYKVKPQARQ